MCYFWNVKLAYVRAMKLQFFVFAGLLWYFCEMMLHLSVYQVLMWSISTLSRSLHLVSHGVVNILKSIKLVKQDNGLCEWFQAFAKSCLSFIMHGFIFWIWLRSDVPYSKCVNAQYPNFNSWLRPLAATRRQETQARRGPTTAVDPQRKSVCSEVCNEWKLLVNSVKYYDA